MPPILIVFKVRANAMCNKIGNYINIDGKQYLQINIQAIPADGKANKAIIDFLSKEWKISKSNFEITRGSTNNFKAITIKNTDSSYLNSILKHYM